MSGEVRLKYNAITSLNDAMVYSSNPTKSPKMVSASLSVGAGETALQNTLVRSLNCIDTHKAKDIGLPFKLHLCELLQTAKPDAKGDYLSTTPGADADQEDAFSELSMFYHVNRAYELFRGYQPSLKVTPNAIPTVSNLRLPQGLLTESPDPTKLGDPNLPLEPLQNAFFSPGDPLFSAFFGNEFVDGAMFFGQGPKRDYSYDATSSITSSPTPS